MPRPSGPRPGGPRQDEKPKNFFGSFKKIIVNLKKWNILLVIALVLGFLSAVLSLIAPNKLSDLADEIQAGLVPNTENLTLVTNEIQNNMTEEKLAEKMANISTEESISKEDYESAMEILSKMQITTTDEEKYSLITTLPDSVLEYLLDDITVEGTTISSEDQVKMFKVLKDMESSTDEEKLSKFDLLPESVYELVKPKIDIEKAKSIVIFMIVIYLLSALFGYIQGFSMTTVSNGYAKSLRTNISNKINKLPLKYFDNHETGDILSRVTNDVDSIAQNLNNSLSTLISSLTIFIGSILMMTITNWIMSLTAILSTILGFMFMFVILGKSQKYFAENQKVLGELNGFIEENYSGHNVVRAYNGTEEAIKEFEDLNQKLFKAKRNSIFLSGLMQPVMGFVGNLGYVAVCVVGAILVLNGKTSFGTIVAFMIYIRMFTNPLSQIAQAMTNLQTSAAAAERVYEFLGEKEMPDQSNLTKVLDKTKVKGEIEFKHVKFGYDESRTIINDFSAKALPGQKIAIVGPTGAGKTTMVNLLMKFYDIKDGDILIDGVSTKELTRENIHDLFVMVLQDTWLFDGSIKDNIKFNKEHVTDEQVMNACKTVGISHFIKTLPGGIDSNVGDNESISSGQKQLLTIARGMIEDAPFLILDEATSNVDTRTEELVQKAMDKLTKGKTSFIIAHRLSTIKNADLILVMNEGNIIETGTHEELIQKGGFYANLYNSQFETISE